MTDPAFIALACTLGPVAYALMAAGTAMVWVAQSKPTDIRESVLLGAGLGGLFWPVVLGAFLVAAPIYGLGLLATWVTGFKGTNA